MGYVVGLALARVFCAAAAAPGMDRERVFDPAVATTVASYCLALAVADGSAAVMLSEVSIAVVFIIGALLGFKRNRWIAAVALRGHGVMDSLRHHLVHNRGVPRNWPGFCAGFDAAAAVLAAPPMLARSRAAAAHHGVSPRSARSR